MTMKFSLVASVMLLTTPFVCSGAQTTDVEAKLTNDTEIMHNGWIELTCDAKKVGLSSNAGVSKLEFRRKLTGSSTEEKIVTYEYKPSAQIVKYETTVEPKYKADSRFGFHGYQEGSAAKPDAFELTMKINKTKCSDAGDYYCLVTYTDKSGQEATVKGHMNLPSIAEITKTAITGTDSDGRNIFKEGTKGGRDLTLNCYVKGPRLLELTWKENGEVIDEDHKPTGVKEVKKYDPTPTENEDGCQQYQYRNTIVVQSGKALYYECNWKYKSRGSSSMVNVAGAGVSWSSGVDTKVTYSKHKSGFNVWYAVGPLLGVVGVCLIAGGVYVYKRGGNLNR